MHSNIYSVKDSCNKQNKKAIINNKKAVCANTSVPPLYIYVSVILCNQKIRELTENFRQFVNCGQFIFLCMQNTEAWPILVCR